MALTPRHAYRRQHEFPFGKVKLTLAFHGSGIAGGHACGFMVEFGGKTVYFAGDTSVFGDMALLPRLETIDVALLPSGTTSPWAPKTPVWRRNC